MSSAANRVLQAALDLSHEEPVEIVECLWDSIEGFATPDLEAAWNEEIAWRIKEADENPTNWLSAEVVDRRLQERFPFWKGHK